MLFGHNNQPTAPYEGCSFVARIAFDYGLRSFKPGERFDYAGLGLVWSQARDLWVSGQLLVEEPVAASAPAHQPKRKGEKHVG